MSPGLPRGIGGQGASYRADIDGLRAIAVLLVIAFHGFPSLMPAGFIGVDVFFVISGFLISSIVFREVERGSFSLVNFYARRVNRIFPALVLLLAGTLAASLLLLDADTRRETGKHVAAGAAFVQNFALLSEAGYFDAEARAKPLLHLWSLAIEEQFYLFWPLVFAWAGARRFRRATLLGIIFAVSFATNLWVSAHRPDLAYFLPFTRFWELALGAALALHSATVHGKAAHPLIRSWGAPLGLALIALGCIVCDSTAAFPDWVGLLPTVGTALVIAAGSDGPISRKWLAAKPLVALGLVSYPLYLWHWAFLSFLYVRLGEDPGAAATVSALLAAALAAWLTYACIEKPLRAWAAVRTRAALLAAAMLVVFAGGVATWLWPGEPASSQAGRPRIEKYLPEWQFDKVCLQAYGQLFTPKVFDDRDFCTESHPGASRTVFVVGDSHANRLAVGLRRFDPSTNYINLARGNCLPFKGVEGTLADRRPQDCQPTSDALVETALRSDAQAVVVTAYFVRAFNGEFSSSGIEDSLARTFRMLGTSGRTVIVVLDVPILPFHPRSCEAVRGESGQWTFPSCRMPRARHDADLARYATRLRELAAPYANIRIFDPTPLLCDASFCYGARAGSLLYWDANHLDSMAAAQVAAALSPLIAAVR